MGYVDTYTVGVAVNLARDMLTEVVIDRWASSCAIDLILPAWANDREITEQDVAIWFDKQMAAMQPRKDGEKSPLFNRTEEENWM